MSIHWNTFHNAVLAIGLLPMTPQDIALLGNGRRNLVDKIVMSKSRYYRYDTLRHECRNLKCTDARDYIYSILNLLRPADACLGITPNYSMKEPSKLFTDVCRQLVADSYSTSFLETCELSSIALPNLPTWVPDWSQPLRVENEIFGGWSACSWISAQAKYISIGNGVLRVAGIQTAKVQRVCHFGDEGHHATFPDMDLGTTIERICRLYGERITDALDRPYPGGGTLLDASLQALNMNLFPDSLYPNRKSLPDFALIKNELLSAWKEDGSWNGVCPYFRESTDNSIHYSTFVRSFTTGRSYFCSHEGYVGLAPYDTRCGDVICVVLGCRTPMVLRRAPVDEVQWEVVGACYVPGLMQGEAIYGDFPSHYRAVQTTTRVSTPYIDDYPFAMLDTRTQTLNTDPAELLAKGGILPTRYQSSPHILEVAPEVLREAGLKLQDFDLV